ncbi:MAG: DUF2812 domain-containing protein [Oscillospiraceae bacterium]|nr:DUF2812 domain-containing protein [Oscillospiraceae bacterium]
MSERKTIRKWFWVWDFEKEERWLNEMALQGWALDGVGWCTYHFRRCEPGEYTVRLEMRTYDESYVAFMEETGAEFVGRMMAWIYFRKKAADGAFDLYSDIDSRIAHLDRIGKMLTVIGGLNLVMGILNSINGNGIGWVNLLCATLLMYALGRIHGKKEALEKNRQLME